VAHAKAALAGMQQVQQSYDTGSRSLILVFRDILHSCSCCHVTSCSFCSCNNNGILHEQLLDCRVLKNFLYKIHDTVLDVCKCHGKPAHQSRPGKSSRVLVGQDARQPPTRLFPHGHNQPMVATNKSRVLVDHMLHSMGSYLGRSCWKI